MGQLKGLLIATSLVNKVQCKPILFSAGDRRTYFNIPSPLSVDLGLLNLAIFIAKELENKKRLICKAVRSFTADLNHL